MLNVADLVALIIFLLSMFLGYKKGFIKTGFGLVAFFIAILITFMFYKPVANLIKEETGFEKWLSEYLYSIHIGENDSQEIDVTEAKDTEYIKNLPANMVGALKIDEVKENAKQIIVEKIVDFTVRLLAIILVYIIARVGLMIIVCVLDLIAKLPILKQFNEILGLLLGGVLGLIRIYAICAIITALSAMAITNNIVAIINSSLFAHIFYDNNLLIKILF